MGSTNVLEVLRCIQESTFSVEMEMIVKNGAFPKPLSIDHAEPSKVGYPKVFEF